WVGLWGGEDDEVTGCVASNIGDSLAVGTESDLRISAALGEGLFGYLGVGFTGMAVEDDELCRSLARDVGKMIAVRAQDQAVIDEAGRLLAERRLSEGEGFRGPLACLA